jgi:ABC-2 type transport system ATP-binding protein
MNLAIETINLTRIFEERKRFSREIKRRIVALQGVNLEVKEGELFGLLGPNGAGKTTLIKILTTLLLPTEGKAYVDGIDVIKDPKSVRERINVVTGGEHSGYGILTVRETLWMFSQFYGIPGKVARKRIDSLLKLVGLEGEANTKISNLSTGMRQKMNFARGFVSDPKIIFLDEPTLGLDVESSRDLRAFIKRWVREKRGRTVLLTTHYMAEAEELCDRIAIINKGKILVCDTPSGLKRMVQRDVIYQIEIPLSDGRPPIDRIPGVERVIFNDNHSKGVTEIKLTLKEDAVLSEVLKKLGRSIKFLEKVEPTLEDVFIKLVGKRMEELDEKK